LERGIHAAIERSELERIGAEQVRSQLHDASADAVGVGWQVKRTERTDLAAARNARVGIDMNDRAIEDRDGLAARPLVAPFVQRQGDLVGADTGDLHKMTALDGFQSALSRRKSSTDAVVAASVSH